MARKIAPFLCLSANVLLFIIHFRGTSALRCYTCSYVAPDSNQACIKDPNSVAGSKYTNCNKKYCTIQRQELVDSGEVNTFLRGCEDKPLYLNRVVEDSTFKTYYRSCTSTLCNGGDGISSSNSASDPDAGAGDNVIVPGKNFAMPTGKLHGDFLKIFILSLLVSLNSVFQI